MPWQLSLIPFFDWLEYLLDHKGENPSTIEFNTALINILSGQWELPKDHNVLLNELEISSDTISFLVRIKFGYNINISFETLKKISEIENFKSIERLIDIMDFDQFIKSHQFESLLNLEIDDDIIAFLERINFGYNINISFETLKKISEKKNFKSIERLIDIIDFGQFIKSRKFESLLNLEIDDDIITFLEKYLSENNCKITFETLLSIVKIENFRSIIWVYTDIKNNKNEVVHDNENLDGQNNLDKNVMSKDNKDDLIKDFNFCDIEFLKWLSMKLRIWKLLYWDQKLSYEQIRSISVEVDSDIVSLLENFSSENNCKISQGVFDYISKMDNFKSFIRFYNYFKMIESTYNYIDYDDKSQDHLNYIKKNNEWGVTKYSEEFKLNYVIFLIALSHELKKWNNDMFDPIYICKLYRYIHMKKHENPNYDILVLCNKFNNEVINHSTVNPTTKDTSWETCTQIRVSDALYNLWLNLNDLLTKYKCNQLDVEKVFYYLNIMNLPITVFNNEEDFKHILCKANNYSIVFLKSFYDDLLNQIDNLSELLKIYDLSDIAKIFYFCNITNTDINEILFNEGNSNYILSDANNYGIDFLKFFYDDLLNQTVNLSKLLETYSLSDIAKIFYYSKINKTPINDVADREIFLNKVNIFHLDFLKSFHDDLLNQTNNLSKLLETYDLSDIAKIFYYSKINRLPINDVADIEFFLNKVNGFDLNFLTDQYIFST